MWVSCACDKTHSENSMHGDFDYCIMSHSSGVKRRLSSVTEPSRLGIRLNAAATTLYKSCKSHEIFVPLILSPQLHPQLHQVTHGLGVSTAESVRTSLRTGPVTELVWSLTVSETASTALRTRATASKTPSFHLLKACCGCELSCAGLCKKTKELGQSATTKNF